MNVNESLQAALQSGVRALTLNQQVCFTQYTRVVIPLDGFVFWAGGGSITVKGSVHYATDRRQNEDETIAIDTVVFTAENEVQDFNQIDTNSIFIARFDGIQFAFSRRSSFFANAGLYHYVGDAVYPAFASQLLDTVPSINLSEAVVSNSLPLWLALNSYSPPYPGFSNSLMLYPSFAVPENLLPPYASVHIEPASTSPLQSATLFSPTMTHSQLATERVRITVYGLQSNAALDLLDCIEQYSFDTDNFGFMSPALVRDGKRTQSEIMALAMQKFIDIEISYYQSRANTVARQLIESVVPSFYIGS